MPVTSWPKSPQVQAMGSDQLRALLRDLQADDRAFAGVPDCRRLELRRYRRSPRDATRRFGGPGASAADGSAAESESSGALTAGLVGQRSREDGGRTTNHASPVVPARRKDRDGTL